ncbi:glycosyltransferase family 39 protein [Hymenobacter sp. BT188]|uniref:glycosyltransferase family 39 protein n=1 Tax=Hymenobacter sp. BT188 TaxID=2763504 RepID=UPI001651680B|nr:glycosyltransferase family 39 protein [Hymenobacter sp. BT188]MBC6606750.1 glycosyltransferase family 39 protein [Hymenobacter sp. BT188]
MKRLVPLLFAGLKFVLGFVLASRVYELHRDEYLYLNYGQHLAWGYLEVPPLMAMQSWLTLALGGGYFWVKFWPLLWGAGTVYVVGRAAQRLGGGRWAQVLACLSYIVCAYSRLNFLFQPNSFEVFAFTLSCYWLIAYSQQPEPRYLYGIGVVLGLSLLNKYTTFFFIGALITALLLTEQRRILVTKAGWIAAGIALALFLPNLIWQIQHGIPFLHHMSLLHESQLVNVSVADFWQDQLLMCFPALWVWVTGLLALLFYQPFRPYHSVGLVFVGGLLLLTVLHGKSYYALGYYPILFAAGAGWLEHQLGNFPRLSKLARPILPAVLLVLAIPLFPYAYALYPPAQMQKIGESYRSTGANRWEDGKLHPLPQDFADMLGWQELADKAWQAYQSLPDSSRSRTLVLCDNYGQAGALNYYNRDRNMPAAHSFNGSYLYWFPTRPAQPYRHILLVTDDSEDFGGHFSNYQRRGKIENSYAREQGTTIALGTNPDTAIINRIYREHRLKLAEWEQHK